MRAILPAGLWAVISGSAVGAAPAQSVPANVRMDARNRLDSLLHAYGPTLKMRFYRDRDDPFEFGGFLRSAYAASRRLVASSSQMVPRLGPCARVRWKWTSCCFTRC